MITAPALNAIKNERVVFSSAFGIERSPFQGQPSEANNKLWAGLYDCMFDIDMFNSILTT